MRIAAIRYINALPLIYGLQKNPTVQLILDTPAECYEKLVNGEVDAALIPAFGTQTSSVVRVVKGLGIAATNQTESVYVFSTKPLDRVECVLTPPSSLTSTILLKIILKVKYNNSPQFHSNNINNIHDALRRYDAVLVIGDDAILTEKTDYDHYDLATEWFSITRLPFVFALWACTRPLLETEQDVLRQSYLEATRNWEDVYNKAGNMLGVDAGFLKRYYNRNLRYQLTKSDYEGLLKFLSLAADFQFVDKVRKDIWV